MMKKTKRVAAAKHRWHHLQESWMQLKEIQEPMAQQQQACQRQDSKGPVTVAARGRPRGCALVAPQKQHEWRGSRRSCERRQTCVSTPPHAWQMRRGPAAWLVT
jgi:hypothetical protein